MRRTGKYKNITYKPFVLLSGKLHEQKLSGKILETTKCI
jgi:hypothetical protein